MQTDKPTHAKPRRLRFTVRTLLVALTVFAICFGGWIGYENQKIRNLKELRNQGAIVILRDGTPQWLKSLGIRELRPFCTIPTVELYVTPIGIDTIVGSSKTKTSKLEAQALILKQSSTAKTNGATNIQLVVVDNFDPEWGAFAMKNSLKFIVETKQRYLKRLEANLESGANINP